MHPITVTPTQILDSDVQQITPKAMGHTIMTSLTYAGYLR
jgi:hypothetical protein